MLTVRCLIASIYFSGSHVSEGNMSVYKQEMRGPVGGNFRKAL